MDNQQSGGQAQITLQKPILDTYFVSIYNPNPTTSPPFSLAITALNSNNNSNVVGIAVGASVGALALIGIIAGAIYMKRRNSYTPSWSPTNNTQTSSSQISMSNIKSNSTMNLISTKSNSQTNLNSYNDSAISSSPTPQFNSLSSQSTRMPPASPVLYQIPPSERNFNPPSRNVSPPSPGRNINSTPIRPNPPSPGRNVNPPSPGRNINPPSPGRNINSTPIRPNPPSPGRNINSTPLAGSSNLPPSPMLNNNLPARVPPKRAVPIPNAVPPVPTTKKPVPPIPITKKPNLTQSKKAKVVYVYDAANNEELSLKVGDTVTIIEEEDSQGWAKGECNGKKGIFPIQLCSSYIDIYKNQNILLFIMNKF